MLKRYFALIIITVLTAHVYSASLWERTSVTGQYIDFSIDDSTHSIYLVENICKEEPCPKSKVIHIDTSGKLLDSFNLSLNVWKMKALGGCFLFDGNEGIQIRDKKGRFVDNIKIGMRAILLNDSLVFYGQDCTDEEGYFSSTDVPKYVYVKNLNTKRIYRIKLNAEPLDAHLRNNRLFIISRKGTLEKLQYTLSACIVFKDTAAKIIGTLPVSGTDIRSEDIWFLSDSLLMCANKLIAYTDTNFVPKQIGNVPFDSVKSKPAEFLGYGGQNKIVFKNEMNKYFTATFLGENTEEYRTVVEKNYPFENTIRILNFSIFTANKERFVFAINDLNDKAALFRVK